jgi:hypothetical protein
VPRRLAVLGIAAFAVLVVVAFAVRGHHSPTRDTFFSTTTTTTSPYRPVAGGGELRGQARVILCTSASTEAECRRLQRPTPASRP